MKGNGNGRMPSYKDVSCPILACGCNKGSRGCFCDYLIHSWPCDHPTHRDRWKAEMDYWELGLVEVEADPVEVHPVQTLTARVSQARRVGGPVSEARQLALVEMEHV